MNENKLSDIQNQFLVNSSLFENSSAYTISSLVGITGSLDVSRLRNAWIRVFDAASILRSKVSYLDEKPIFVEDSSCKAPWDLVECGEGDVEILAFREAERPFDLGTAPLVRVVLFRVSETVHSLLIVQHHIITDLFSKQLLAASLSRAYGDPSNLPGFIPYNRFSEAESAWLEISAGHKARDYWSAKMRQNFETLKLPSVTWTQKPFTASGRQIPWRLPETLAGKLSESEKSGKAPFLLFLAAYACVLSRLSGQTRFLVGVPLTNRLSFPDEPLLGPCVNILPIGIEVNPGDTFSALYDRIRTEMLLAHRHQGFPFMEISRMYAAERDPVRPWLLQAGFTNEPPMALDLEGLSCAGSHVYRTGAQMDFFFTWWRRGETWEGFWEYNEASFGEAEVLLAQASFTAILGAGLQDADVVLNTIRLCDDRAEKSLSCAGAEEAYPLEKTMAFHLGASYALHAGETALVYRGEKTSYARFADGVARVASGIYGAYGDKGRVVALFERSPDMLYALHGIVLSGNAYVPLGIDWPDDRIADILDDIEPSLILTQEKFLGRFASASCPVTTVVSLLESRSSLKNSPLMPPTTLSPADAIYILYTSGTTGRPKGVELPHSGIVNHVFWMQNAYGLMKSERCMLKTAYTFDVSVWELFWPFIAGASLVIAEEGLHKDPREILNLAVSENVTRLDFVPSLLDLFLEQEGLEKLTGLTDVQCIGEALPVALLERFLNKLPNVRLHNLYGPTEASVSVTSWECGEADIGRNTVPIGFPMANTRVYIVDDAGLLCPPLVKGELLIGGVPLATGYWKREEITREKFIPNPFGPGRLYRTGDWCRYGLDGAVEYLERKDTQTKIRGVRVELGEIEAYIRKLEAIENAVVKKGKTPSGHECLIAYFTLKPGKSADGAGIRAQLRNHLSEAIIPEYCVALDAFPMNENGKLDRKALPETAPAAAAEVNPFAQPLEPREDAIAKLWEQVLRKPCTDAGQNFFDSGGSSLSLLSLRRLLEESFGRTVKVAELFQRPTIKGMALIFNGDGENDISNTGASLSERAKKQQIMMQGLGARGRIKR